MDLKFVERIKDKECDIYVFQVVDVIGTDIRNAISTAMMVFLDTEGNIQRSLSKTSEDTIIKKIKPEIDACCRRSERCIVVQDITQFPTVNVYVDIRDQNKVMADANDQFARDVVLLWETYDTTTHVPSIIVNLNISHTGLKILPLSS